MNGDFFPTPQSLSSDGHLNHVGSYNTGLGLNFYFELNITYKKWFLAISYLSVTGLIFVMSSDRYKYIFYNTIFENLQKYDVWIFTPTLYILIYLLFYLLQIKYTIKA